MRARIVAILVALVLPIAAGAQPTGTVTFDVPLQRTNASGEPAATRLDFGAAVEAAHLFSSERGRVFYEMTMDSFGSPDRLRTWLHNAGVTGTFGSERRALDVGGSFFWRANEGTWSDAGFRGVNLLASARVKPLPTVTLGASYALYIRSFPDQSALDQTEHYGALRTLVNLPSRTTLVSVLSVGRKGYDGREPVVVYADVPTAGTLTSGQHMGRGWRQSVWQPASVELTGTSGTRREWSWAARIAQSLDDRTGVWLEREERRTSGDLPPAIVWTPPLFYDDGVYDDPYVIDARTWRVGARHVFEAAAEVSVWGSESERSYAGLDRRDTLRRAGTEAVFPLAAGARTQVSAVVGYDYFRNASSEVLESYRAHQGSVGLRLGF